MNKQNKIPVTIITGFLGAGKTTLINNLLKKYSETQFALVENEFGDVAIDTKLIKGVDASQMFELKQGCICCTITDEYELVLAELAERFPNVEHLLIETTGIADPATVIQPFFRDENLKELYQYNGTICIVDALNFETQPEQEIRIKQLTVADLVLINKTDHLVEKEKLQLQNYIKKINPFARQLMTEFANTKAVLLDSISNRLTNPDFSGSKSEHSNIQTKTFHFETPLNKEEFIRTISYALDIYKTQIYRCKGLLCFINEPYEYILQGIGGNVDITEGELILGIPKSTLVFIGKLEGVDFPLL